MKKLFLSLIVIGILFFYSISQRKIIVNTPISSPLATLPPNNPGSQNVFKDGSYTGDTADAYYGNIQVKTIIQNGKIADVQFLQYPNDRPRSNMISMMSMPILKQETIQAQNSQVDIVTGATDTSQAFINSLASALSQAK